MSVFFLRPRVLYRLCWKWRFGCLFRLPFLNITAVSASVVQSVLKQKKTNKTNFFNQKYHFLSNKMIILVKKVGFICFFIILRPIQEQKDKSSIGFGCNHLVFVKTKTELVNNWDQFKDRDNFASVTVKPDPYQHNVLLSGAMYSFKN